MKKLILIDRDVLCWADRNCLLAIQFKDKTIAVGQGMLPFFRSGIRLSILVPARRVSGGEYENCGWGFRLMPALHGAVSRWPKWYRAMWRYCMWRNYEVDGVLKREARRHG